nr:FtsQ-type POTRA domain-containing protein [Treponema sp.]
MSDFVFQSFGKGLKKAIGMEKREKSKGTNRIRALKWFVAVFAVIFAIEAVVYLIIIPSLQKPMIIWSGERNYNVVDLSKAISPMLNKSWAKFDEIETAEYLLNVSGIEDAQVVKRFPDKVYINVVEREPVAMTFISEGGKSVPIQIDKNGVLFKIRSAQSRSDSDASASGKIDVSLPLITGLPVDVSSGRMQIPPKYRGLMEQIAAIRNLSQNYFAAISEIHIVTKEYGNYELVLYPVRGHARILIGRQITEEALQYMMVALDVVNSIDPNVAEIDLRYGSVACRTRRSTGDSF